MPLAIALAAPKRVVGTRIRRLDATRRVAAALGRDAAALHLDVLARGGVRTGVSRLMAVLHMVRRGGSRGARSGRVDVCLRRVAVRGDGVVV